MILRTAHSRRRMHTLALRSRTPVCTVDRDTSSFNLQTCESNYVSTLQAHRGLAPPTLIALQQAANSMLPLTANRRGLGPEI